MSDASPRTPDHAHGPRHHLPSPSRVGEAVAERVAGPLNEIAETIAEVKPRLRGWLHFILVPMVVSGTSVLITLSPTPLTRIGSAVFGACALLLFSVSAAYHTQNWSPGVHRFLKRWDHANIYLLIAGSYTPLTFILLHGVQRAVLISVVWACALLGVLFRIFWNDAPRWLYTPLYIGLGWAAVFFLPGFIDGADDQFSTATAITVLVLIAAGGGLYTFGGVVYGLKRPNPSPQWFGFHEVFHTFTVAAFVCHYVAISMATYALR